MKNADPAVYVGADPSPACGEGGAKRRMSVVAVSTTLTPALSREERERGFMARSEAAIR
jgi:hypothetical protein